MWLRRKEEWETPRGRRQARPAGQAPSRGQHACCAPVKEKGTRLRFESPRADARKGRRRRGRPREHIGEGGAHQGGACGAMEPTSRTHATRERARGRRGSTPCCSSLPRRPQRRVHLRHQADMGDWRHRRERSRRLLSFAASLSSPSFFFFSADCKCAIVPPVCSVPCRKDSGHRA